MTPVNLRHRGLARTPGLRAAFAAPGLRQWIHGNSQRVTAAVATRRLWIGCCCRSPRLVLGAVSVAVAIAYTRRSQLSIAVATTAVTVPVTVGATIAVRIIAVPYG